jgi:hypothetical protein
MGVLETKRLQLDRGIVSVEYDGTPLPKEWSIGQRIKHYQKAADQKKGLTPKAPDQREVK